LQFKNYTEKNKIRKGKYDKPIIDERWGKNMKREYEYEYMMKIKRKIYVNTLYILLIIIIII